MTTLALKLVAVASMLVDHTGAALAGVYDTFTLRMIGRTAFPIYAFLIAEGCRRTRDIRKYMLRLFIFAFISEAAFDLFLYRRLFDLRGQNVFFTLFLGAAAIWLYEHAQTLLRGDGVGFIKKIPLAAVLSCIPSMVIAYLIKTDYGAYGVFAIYACYVFKRRAVQVIVLTVTMLVLYRNNATAMLAVLPAAFFIAAYNGLKGKSARLAFYCFYPLHLIALSAIRYFWFF